MNLVYWLFWISIAANLLAAGCSSFRIWRLRKKRSRAVAKLPEMLPLLEEINAGFASITQADIERVERSCQSVADGDTKLGVVHSMEARRLYALGFRLKIESQEAALAAHGKASSEDEAILWKEQAARISQMEDCVREWFWAQVRDDIGGKAWTSGAVGIRAGWMLVALKNRMPSLPSFQFNVGEE